MMIRRLASLFLLVLAAACTVHTMSPAADSISVNNSYPPHDRQVRLVKGGLPPGARYQVLGKVKAVESFYGELAKADTSLAGMARSLGADAVIDEKAWTEPYGLAFLTPHAEGTAVKLIGPSRIDLATVPGEWY
jgi:hypothetical protein